MLINLAMVDNMKIKQWVLFDFLRSYKTLQILIMCQGVWFISLWMINARLFLSDTGKILSGQNLVVQSTVAITGRVKKDNSAEIEQVLAKIWWALNQAAVIEVKSIFLHKGYSQTLLSEMFHSVCGFKSISAVKRKKTVYVLPEHVLAEEGGKGGKERKGRIQPDQHLFKCLPSGSLW